MNTMFNKYSRKRKIREFKDTMYVGTLMLQCYIASKIFGYDWKTGRYDKKHIIGRFLYNELRVGPTLIPKEEVTVHPMGDPIGMIEHCNYVQRDKIP